VDGGEGGGLRILKEIEDYSAGQQPDGEEVGEGVDAWGFGGRTGRGHGGGGDGAPEGVERENG
jgi:hypothetical protein